MWLCIYLFNYKESDLLNIVLKGEPQAVETETVHVAFRQNSKDGFSPTLSLEFDQLFLNANAIILPENMYNPKEPKWKTVIAITVVIFYMYM